MAKKKQQAKVADDEDTRSAANRGSADDAAQQAVLENVLKVVRQCLSRIKAGDLFMADLDKERYDQLTPATMEDDSGQEKMTKVFRTFLGAVADILASESAESMGGASTDAGDRAVKKMRKKWMKVLREHFEVIEAEVKKDMAASPKEADEDKDVDKNDAVSDVADGGNDEHPQSEHKSEAEAGVKGKDDAKDEGMANADADTDVDGTDKNGEHTSEHDDSEEDGVDSRTSSKRSKSSKKSKKKDKSKRAKRKKRKKKKRKARELLEDDDDDVDDLASDAGEPMAMGDSPLSQQEARELFETKKEEVLSMIPQDVKARFRQCGFASWGRVVYPMIELGPYDVPPGDLRDQWFSMFENVSFTSHLRMVYDLHIHVHIMLSSYSFCIWSVYPV